MGYFRDVTLCVPSFLMEYWMWMNILQQATGFLTSFIIWQRLNYLSTLRNRDEKESNTLTNYDDHRKKKISKQITSKFH